MIVAAALLVLVGAGLFVAGLLTGVSVLFWACVAACVVAAVLLIAARRSMPAAAAPAPVAEDAEPVVPAAGAASGEPAGPEVAAPAEPVVATAGATAVSAPPAPQATGDEGGDPPVEEVEVTDLLLVIDLQDEVLVIDEHPRYHVAGCRHLSGRTTIPLPLDEARTDGFTPCGVCRPDATLADRVRARR